MIDMRLEDHLIRVVVIHWDARIDALNSLEMRR